MAVVVAVGLWAVLVLGIAAAVAGLAYGVVRAVRDKRTPQEKWADEHGDDDNPFRAGAQLVNGITFGSRR